MASIPPGPLWELVRDLERRQLHQWRTEFYPSEELESVCTERLMKIETTVTRLRNGNSSVTVAILAKKDADSVAGYFRLQKVLNGQYAIVNGTLSNA